MARREGAGVSCCRLSGASAVQQVASWKAWVVQKVEESVLLR